MRHTVIAFAAAAALAGCQRSVEVVSGGEVAPVTPVVPANASMLSAGATMEVQLNQQLSTETSKVGDTFTAFQSSDGIDWFQVDSSTASFPRGVHAAISNAKNELDTYEWQRIIDEA